MLKCNPMMHCLVFAERSMQAQVLELPYLVPPSLRNKMKWIYTFVQEYDSAASIMTTKVNPMCVLVLKDNSIYSW